MARSALIIALVATACAGTAAPTSTTSTTTAREAETVFDRIEMLLDEMVAAYQDGRPEEAGELAAEAYLENYEIIEHEVEEAAAEVHEELEPLLSAELRALIRDQVPLDRLRQAVERAEELLAEARRALEEAG